MEQASALPDPLEKSGVENAPSADDLLAQMAGDEIDRLLSEADVERPEVDAAQPAVLGPVTTEAAPAAVEAAVAGAVEAPPDAIPPQPAAEATAAQEVDPNISQQLDALFQQLNAPPEPASQKSQISDFKSVSPDPQAPRAADPAPPAQASGAVETGTPNAPASPVDPADQLGERERQTLTAGMPQGGEATAVPEAVVPSETGEPGIPPLLRPLVWINAPVASCSESVRNAIGNIAILTLLNAIAVLAYVLIFRR